MIMISFHIICNKVYKQLKQQKQRKKFQGEKLISESSEQRWLQDLKKICQANSIIRGQHKPK